MGKMISASAGFITNSSSVVYHFPAALLADAKVAAFLKAFEIEGGYVGENLWNRGECGSFAVTREQKAELRREFTENEYDATGPTVNVESDEVVIVYGDEYQDVTTELCRLLVDAMVRAGLAKDRWGVGGQDYN